MTARQPGAGNNTPGIGGRRHQMKQPGSTEKLPGFFYYRRSDCKLSTIGIRTRSSGKVAGLISG